MPELAVKCIESWKKYLPEYELRLWNEETFDLDMYPYARAVMGTGEVRRHLYGYRRGDTASVRRTDGVAGLHRL